MSLQKRFKARYPKANFADFKTGDFFGKPNIFFHSEAGEGTTVFDDDGKDFRSSIYFSKEDERDNLVSHRVSLLNWLTIQTLS